MKSGFTALILLATALAAPAQTNLAAGAVTNRPAIPPTNSPPKGPDHNVPASVSPLDRFLNAGQRKIYDQAFLASQGKFYGLNQQVRQMRQELSLTMFATNFDEAAFRAREVEIARVQGDADLLLIQDFQKILPLLSTNQINQIRTRLAPPVIRTPVSIGDPAKAAPTGQTNAVPPP